MDWCPQLKCLDTAILLRADGTLGSDDPVSWPQPFHPDTPHLPCIPLTSLDPLSPTYPFRHGLRKEQVTFTDGWDGNLRVAVLSKGFIRTLESSLDLFHEEAQRFLAAVEESHPRLTHLVDSLKAATAIISTLQDTLPRLRLAFGLTSRFYLEARGYIDYHLKYRPALDSREPLKVDTNLVGVLVTDDSACADHHRMGIPVWSLQGYTQAKEGGGRFVEMAEPRTYQSRPLWPPGCFRDDGCVRGEEPLFGEQQADTWNFMKAVDAWAKSKLEDSSR